MTVMHALTAGSRSDLSFLRCPSLCSTNWTWARIVHRVEISTEIATSWMGRSLDPRSSEFAALSADLHRAVSPATLAEMESGSILLIPDTMALKLAWSFFVRVFPLI